MKSSAKAIAPKATTFDALELRVGRIVAICEAAGSPKRAYRIEADFGRFGRRVSVGRFTHHEPTTIIGALIAGVLNFEPRKIGETTSDFLCLGVQYPGAEAGEACLITPLRDDVKVGGRIF